MSPFTNEKPRKIRVGSRGSKLALIQTQLVVDDISRAYPDVEVQIVPVVTEGDANKGLWTKELETLLLDGTLDILVHSMKDVPTEVPAGCIIHTWHSQADSRDACVMKTGSQFTQLSELPSGATVGTSSVRRVAQIRYKYPHLNFKDIRGNLDTRLKKLDAEDSPYDCLILAAAGLQRMSLTQRITEFMDSEVFPPAVGQGTLGIEIRDNDPVISSLVAEFRDWKEEWACAADRALLKAIQGGCSVPLGVHSTLIPNEKEQTALITVTALLTSISGTKQVTHSQSRMVSNLAEVEGVGEAVATYLRDHDDSILGEVDQLRAAKAGLEISAAHTTVKGDAQLLDCPAISAVAQQPDWQTAHPNLAPGASALDCPVLHYNIEEKIHDK